jgi:hypothetical protein
MKTSTVKYLKVYLVVYFVEEKKVIYIQRKGEDRLFTPVRVINPKLLDKKIYRVVDKDEVFEYGIYRINPNSWYVLGKDKEARKIFGMYLNSHHPLLKDLFIRASTEDPPSFFYQDAGIKRVLLEKFHNNLDFGIFDVDAGKIVVRRMNNKEALYKLKNILADMYNIPELKIFNDKINSMTKEFEKLKKRMNVLSDRRNALISTPNTDPNYLQKTEELKLIEKKLLYSPLWLE